MKSVVGIIGAGVMGRGVAITLASKGYTVILIDKSKEILDVSKSTINDELIGYEFAYEDISRDCIENICFTTNYEMLKNASYIIENVSEDITLKKEVYTLLSKMCLENCLFLANTSCISITKIASFCTNEERVVGVHFMNPVPLIKGVEVIRGIKTSEETLQRLSIFLESIEKKQIVINDSVGFVSNRISHLMMNEAMFLMYEGVANPSEIDEIFRTCYGHKMGPLETADLIGLDTVLDSLNILYEEYQDTKFRACPLLKKMVDARFLGKKTNKGFYEY